MATKTLELKEKKLRNLFNKQSSSYDQSLSGTAQAHKNIVCGTNAKSVIDVGSGPGSLLLEMLENGVEIGIGIDLADGMNQIATQRLEEAKISDDRYKILEGSFLELNQDNFPDIVDQYDAVSLHLVLCCHPDREGLLRQAAKFRPNTIVITLPRPWLVLRLVATVWGLVSQITKGFQPYIHSQKSVDKQLLAAGYELKERKKTLGKVVSGYHFNDQLKLLEVLK